MTAPEYTLSYSRLRHGEIRKKRGNRLDRASRKKKGEVLSRENFSSFCLFVPKGRVGETTVKRFASTILGRNPSYSRKRWYSFTCCGCYD